MSSHQRDLAKHRKRLARLLRPMTEPEHHAVTYLAQLTLSQPEVATMIERRIRAARRAARTNLAQQVIAYWMPAPGSPVDVMADMEFLASGGDELEQLERDQQIGDERRTL